MRALIPACAAPCPSQTALRATTELSLYALLRADYQKQHAARSELQGDPAPPPPCGASSLARLIPVSHAAARRETRTTRPVARTATTAPRTTTRTATDPTTTPTTTGRLITTRPHRRRLRRCTPLLLRSKGASRLEKFRRLLSRVWTVSSVPTLIATPHSSCRSAVPAASVARWVI